MKSGISIGEGAVWVLTWFGVMLLYTLLDVTLWRKMAPRHARLLNLISVAFCMGGFLILLKTKSHFQPDLAYGITLQGIILAIVCAGVLYFLLDKFLDPIFEGILMRGFLLDGLSINCLLYIRTGSLICCITAHAGYNMISYFTMILPRFKKL